MHVRKFIGMMLGFGGVAVMFSDGSLLKSSLGMGDGIVFLATICWAVNAVFTKTIIHRFDPFHLVLYPMLFAAPMQFLQGWLWDDVMVHHINGPVVTAMLYQSLICAAFGFLVWNHFMARYGTSTLHSFVFIMPIAGVSASWWVLGEPMSINLGSAVTLVAVGIILVNTRPKSAAMPIAGG